MSNSPLVSYTNISPNKNSPRVNQIDRITPHCVVGQCSVETIGNMFSSPTRQVSSNYGIGSDGRIGMYVDEKDRSWCSSSANNDHKAITIECASDTTEPYTMNDKVYNSLINLCVDICKRNGKNKLLWFADKDKTLSYIPKENEMLITVHRWFANKACPGDWLYNRLGDLAAEVTGRLNPESNSIYRIQVGAYSLKENAENFLHEVKAAGFTDAFIKQEINKTSDIDYKSMYEKEKNKRKDAEKEKTQLLQDIQAVLRRFV